MKKYILIAILAAAGLWSCNEDSLDASITVDSNFQSGTGGTDGWTPEYAGFAATADSTQLDTVAATALLPRGLDTTQYGYRILSRYSKGNMFSYLKKRVSGFTPNKSYEMVLQVDLATRYTASTIVDKVTFKAGVSPIEPLTKLVSGTYTFNLDKGTGNQSGKAVLLAGSIASTNSDTRYHTLLRYSNDGQPVTVVANNEGELWFFAGTDSDYKDTTIFYFDRIIARFKEL
ncbi:hypothetical protein ACN9ML_28500 [Dyadobacter endophyticus]|uniref:DUF4397 domain-containing protein n=1 Tax=Dyadobacter endophyticus TaxID=1749036 RepID=A0ABQ1YV24_9BACT|nr:hypothetical protein [Dyadobacter endophyticus]GGH37596.1 hypothetical protein GCM10007423_30740 [Dyadobacter endophyticus]